MGRQAGLTGLLLPEFERESSRQTCTIAVADMTAVIDHFFAEGVISDAGNSQLSLRDGFSYRYHVGRSSFIAVYPQSSQNLDSQRWLRSSGRMQVKVYARVAIVTTPEQWPL